MKSAACLPTAQVPRQTIDILSRRSLYPRLLRSLIPLSETEQTHRLRDLYRTDLYALLRYGCNRADCDNDWVFDRCREVQRNPDGYLDLWAREHYKSTIITFALTIQDILRNPEITVGIFSHTRPIAKGFLRQIKREFESNVLLKRLFADVLWDRPGTESPKWSEDEGIIVKRKGNPKEATLEAWGLVDGQPTSKHYKLQVYDDTVTRESVTTPDMIGKVRHALRPEVRLAGLENRADSSVHCIDSQIARRLWCRRFLVLAHRILLGIGVTSSV